LHITPVLVPGSNGIYDITADQTTIFSKHQSRRFPDNREIIDQLRRLLP
jgi:predicted Rdx family selenoprotein